jgi:transcriptional regulator with XRE-family HTH domain
MCDVSALLVRFYMQTIDLQGHNFTRKFAVMPMELNELLRKIRRDANFSQENVAEEIGVDVTTYGRYEKGETQIKFEHVVKLAEFYKMTLDEFYHYGEKKFDVVAEANELYRREEKRVDVIVHLDGSKANLDRWVKKLYAINDVL